MYKSAPADINEFINENYPKQEEFSYEELCNLVTKRNSSLKERDMEDTWQLISSKGNHGSKTDILNALNYVGIETNEREVFEMIEYMNSGSNNESSDTFNKEDFKKFFY